MRSSFESSADSVNIYTFAGTTSFRRTSKTTATELLLNATMCEDENKVTL